MMHGGMCKCPHHIVNKVLMLLAWIAGVLFFWSSWGARTFWGFDALYWAWSVVVLVLMAKASKFCGCCGHGMMGKMEGGMCKCNCGSCEGGKCNNMHGESHQHM